MSCKMYIEFFTVFSRFLISSFFISICWVNGKERGKIICTLFLAHRHEEVQIFLSRSVYYILMCIHALMRHWTSITLMQTKNHLNLKKSFIPINKFISTCWKGVRKGGINWGWMKEVWRRILKTFYYNIRLGFFAVVVDNVIRLFSPSVAQFNSLLIKSTQNAQRSHLIHIQCNILGDDVNQVSVSATQLLAIFTPPKRYMILISILGEIWARVITPKSLTEPQHLPLIIIRGT